MAERDTPHDINDRATVWVARIDAGPLDAAAERELDQWLARDDRHRGALFRATVAWRMLDRANALGTQRANVLETHRHDTPPGGGGEDAVEPVVETVGRRGLLWGGAAIAASLVAGAVGMHAFLTRPATSRIQTALGEIRHVPLGDGSKVVVNTGSLLEIAFTPAERNVRIEQGEAWFKVAKDKARPFIVAAGEARVRAVGTAFAVRKRAGGVDVGVTEGVVDVWTAGHENGKQAIGPGTRTFVTEYGTRSAPVRDSSGVDRRLAWRDGALQFEGDTLSAATAEFNRYNRTKLEIDPVLAAEKVVGRFRVDEPDTFARTVSTMFDARIERGKGVIRIARKEKGG
jgi:transmembrane sensor